MNDIVDLLQNPTEHTVPFTELMNDAADEITRLRAENEILAGKVGKLEAECFSLASWQCVYTDGKTGLVGDEHGNQYCAMAKRVDALRARVEKLEWALKWIVDKYDEAMPMRSADFHIPDCTCMRCARDNARAALGDTHE